jgi:hypothetical protein
VRVHALNANKRTFAEAAGAYLAAHAPSWKHGRSRELSLKPMVRYAYPVIGHKLLDDIGVADIKAVMDATMAKRPRPGRASGSGSSRCSTPPRRSASATPS